MFVVVSKQSLNPAFTYTYQPAVMVEWDFEHNSNSSRDGSDFPRYKSCSGLAELLHGPHSGTIEALMRWVSICQWHLSKLTLYCTHTVKTFQPWILQTSILLEWVCSSAVSWYCVDTISTFNISSLYQGSNWGPSDPEADDIPMCHSASLYIYFKS